MRELELKLPNVIDEKADFSVVNTDKADAEIRLNCREVTRINSVGVRIWVQNFGKAARAGKKITLVDCALPIVEQLNTVSGFACGGRVESMELPYHCPSCDSEFSVFATTAALAQSGYRPPEASCPKCQKVAEFDEIEDKYFHFVKKQG